jgi:asparagine synthase (glutamine-hydrolysing)
LRNAAKGATTAWAGLYNRIALDLSGGLDSAILLGLLRQGAAHPGVVGVNYTTAHPESDERAFARDAARRHGIDLIEREMLASDDRRAPAPSRRLLRPAARILTTLYDDVATEVLTNLRAEAYFTGTGGDHLFYDHVPICAACDYRRIRGFDAGLIDVSLQLASLSKNTVWHVLGAVVGDIGKTRPDLTQLLGRDNPLLTASARESVDVARFAHPWLAASIGVVPPAKLHQILLIAELQRHYARYGRAEVAEEGHPLFSQPVMEACLRIPSYWFGEDGMPRGLARRAFDDLLPPSIARRRSKGANTALWVEVIRGRLHGARERLLDGALVSRGLVDRGRLRIALDDLEVTGSKKLQSQLTECLAIEQWLQDAASRPPATSLASV